MAHATADFTKMDGLAGTSLPKVVRKRRVKTMYTGTLIEDLIAAVELAEAAANDLDPHKHGPRPG